KLRVIDNSKTAETNLDPLWRQLARFIFSRIVETDARQRILRKSALERREIDVHRFQDAQRLEVVIVSVVAAAPGDVQVDWNDRRESAIGLAVGRVARRQ